MLDPTLESITASFNDFSMALSELSQSTFEVMRESTTASLNNTWSMLSEFEESLAKLPERLRRALLIAANHGWFLYPGVPLNSLWELEAALESGDTDACNQALSDYFSSELPEIEQRLKVGFPRRARLIEAGFSAHNRKEYAVSVPMFLIQADGICQDLVGFQLYRRKNGVPAINGFVESSAADMFRSAALYPLTRPLPISASASERSANFDNLNRHQVLHGESTDYDTALNSLKAISWLNYVSYVLAQGLDGSTRGIGPDSDPRGGGAEQSDRPAGV
jgi:hypothetical protein